MVKQLLALLERMNMGIQLLSGILLAIMTILVLVQIFFRYILGNPLGQTQELAIYAMVWVIMLGSTIAVRNKTHIAVTFFVDKLGKGAGKAAVYLGYVLMLVFFFILLDQGWALTQRAMLQRSPATGLPVGYVVASIPTCAAISILYIFEQIVGTTQTQAPKAKGA